MTDLGGISVERREGGNGGAGSWAREDFPPPGGRWGCPGFGHLPECSGNVTPVQYHPRGHRDEELCRQQANGPINTGRRTPQDCRTKFYEQYRKEAEEYDKEFMKAHDEDLNTTLIFAGLFSAVTSAFIIQVQSQLQSDPNEETAALLRFLIHKLDNSTFGDKPPPLPQWGGPPPAIVNVQCLLYASLVTSLLSAFLAMLGKQWLNRYASIDMRGSVIERCQNRQRKLDGIVAWYFDFVMESLPLMLQAALLLFGCAISKYLWGIDTAVASVVVGVTSFGVLFYLFIVVAGTISDSCPYQSPATNIICRVSDLLRSAHTLWVKNSEIYDMTTMWWGDVSSRSAFMIFPTVLLYPLMLLITFFLDVFRLGRATFLAAVAFIRRVSRLILGTSPIPTQAFDSHRTELDFRCISWMLQTSMDKIIKLSALNFLGTILPLCGPNSSINPAVVVDCLNILGSCLVSSGGYEKVVASGSEQLAEVAAMSFLRTFSYLLSTEPTCVVIRDVRRRYQRLFPQPCDVQGLASPVIMRTIHSLLTRPWDQPMIDWRGYNPSSITELITFSRALAQAAQSRFLRHRARRQEQPNGYQWLIRFALRFLSQDPPPPTSVILDCLVIIAADLRCNLPDTDSSVSDDARLEQVFTSIIQGYQAIASDDRHMGVSAGEATIAFLPYAARREEGGAVLPISLKYATLDAFRHAYLFLEHASDTGAMMQLWIAAASTLPYTGDIGERVIDALLQMAFQDYLRPHIPTVAWEWLKKRPVLHPRSPGLKLGTTKDVVRAVRELGDIALVTSYLFVTWSEWSDLDTAGCEEVHIFVRTELSGIHAAEYRADLLQRLDYVLTWFDRGWQYAWPYRPIPTEPEFLQKKQWYERFKKELLEVEEAAMKTLAGSHSTFLCSLPFPCP